MSSLQDSLQDDVLEHKVNKVVAALFGGLCRVSGIRPVLDWAEIVKRQIPSG